MNKPKEAVLLVNVWRNAGGIEAVNHDIARAFIALGWQLSVVSVFGGEGEADIPGVALYHAAPRGRLARYAWCRFFWKPGVAWRLFSRRAASDILIVGHAHLLNITSWLPACLAPRRWAWVHGLEVWGEQAKRWTDRLNQMDLLISVSSFTKEQIRMAGVHRPIEVVPNCVDVEAFRPTNTPEKIRRDEILICGRMDSAERDKGHEALFRCLPLVERALGRTVFLRVVGDGSDRPRLEILAEQLGVRDRVLFVGRLPRAALLEAYQHCGVFCMPTRVDRVERGYWNGEGFGIVYVEAAACGRPVIASREGGAPETIVAEETGLLVNPRSIPEIAEAIVAVLSDPQKADNMGAHGRQLAESRFSFSAFVEAISRSV
jgi:phosphatidylinositol alpha-1,6-mannosyltransferase